MHVLRSKRDCRGAGFRVSLRPQLAVSQLAGAMDREDLATLSLLDDCVRRVELRRLSNPDLPRDCLHRFVELIDGALRLEDVNDHQSGLSLRGGVNDEAPQTGGQRQTRTVACLRFAC
jgi:hypothetical protein